MNQKSFIMAAILAAAALSVRRSLVKDSNFLNSIGNAQMMQELETRVLDMTKKNSDILEKQSGKEPSMTNEEIRTYIHYVMNEYGKKERNFSR